METPGSEQEALHWACQTLGLSSVDPVKHRSGRKLVARHDNVVVKAFSCVQHAAWLRELAGCQALVGYDIAPTLLAHGERWVATAWVDNVSTRHSDLDQEALHEAIGSALVQLHAVPPTGLPTLSLADRLLVHLDHPPPLCSPALAEAVRNTLTPWLELLREDTFVHGDYGTSNVGMDPKNPQRVCTILDFEDAHLGDPTEDFKCQAMYGPDSPHSGQLAGMLKGYSRDLGPHVAERIAIGAAQICLDVLTWDFPSPTLEKLKERNAHVLTSIVDGWRPGE